MPRPIWKEWLAILAFVVLFGPILLVGVPLIWAFLGAQGARDFIFGRSSRGWNDDLVRHRPSHLAGEQRASDVFRGSRDLPSLHPAARAATSPVRAAPKGIGAGQRQTSEPR